MKTCFDQQISRRDTHSLKWDEALERTGHTQLIPFWVADMDFLAPEPVIKVLAKRAAHGIYGYTSRPQEYYQAVCQWMNQQFNWAIQPNWIVFTPGIVTAVNIAVQAFTQPSDKIIIQSPVYAPFFQAVQNNGRQLSVNPLKENNLHYTMDFSQLKSLIDKHTKMLILSSPHNPVGRVWQCHELETLTEICLKNDLLIISDEIHHDLILKDFKHTPTACLSQYISQKTITCTAPSKTFNLAGLQTSNVIIENEDLRKKYLTALKCCGLHLSNTFGIEALMAAYQEGKPWLLELLNYLQDNFLYLKQFIAAEMPAIQVTPLEGTYLVWLDCRKIEPNDLVLQKQLIEKAGIWLDEGSKFGNGGQGFLRMNIACPRSQLILGLEKFKQFLKEN